MKLSKRDVSLVLQGLKYTSTVCANVSDDDKRRAKNLEDIIGSKFTLGAEMAPIDKRFRGVRILRSHEGVSLLTHDGDQRFMGKSENIEFLVYAKDIEEANGFAQNAFGINNFEWD